MSDPVVVAVVCRLADGEKLPQQAGRVHRKKRAGQGASPQSGPLFYQDSLPPCLTLEGQQEGAGLS